MNFNVPDANLVRPKIIFIRFEFPFDSGVVLDRGGGLSKQFEWEKTLDFHTSNRGHDLEIRLFPDARVTLDHALDCSEFSPHIRQRIIESFGDSIIEWNGSNSRAVDPKPLEPLANSCDQLPQVTNKTGTIGIDARGPAPDLTQERDKRICDAARLMAVVGKRNRQHTHHRRAVMAQLRDYKVHRRRALMGNKISRLCQRRFERSELVDKRAQANVAAEFINAFHMKAQNPGLGKLVNGTAHGGILKAE